MKVLLLQALLLISFSVFANEQDEQTTCEFTCVSSSKTHELKTENCCKRAKNFCLAFDTEGDLDTCEHI